MQHPRKERIILKDRKGFVRIAVEEGLHGGIVPVYHFGNTQVFDFMPQVRGCWLGRACACKGVLCCAVLCCAV